MAGPIPNRNRLWLYLMVAAIIAFLVIPILIIIPMSFSGKRYLEFPPETWSLRWYQRFFGSLDWMSAVSVSLQTAVVTTLVATPMGVAAAYALHTGAPRLMRYVQTYLMLPLLVPHIMLGIALFYIYVKLDIVGTAFGLVFAHTMLALPFVVVTTLGGLRTYDMTQELVARSLGSSRLNAFLRITLPQIKASVMAGALFAFVTSLDEVIVSLFIGAGLNQTITKVMFGSVQIELDPTVAAVSTVLVLGSFLVLLLSVLTSRLAGRAAGT